MTIEVTVLPTNSLYSSTNINDGDIDLTLTASVGGTAVWKIDVNDKDNCIINHTSGKVAYFLTDTSRKFTTIERALEVATSGTIVTVYQPNGANYNPSSNSVTSTEKKTYTIKRNCEIKNGVTFIVPTDNSSITSVNNTS